MAYDNTREVVVLEGGSNGYSDTWEWDGVKWIERSFDSPAYVYSGHPMVFDSWRNEIVTFGFLDYESPVWEYSPGNVSPDLDGDLVADECDQCPATPAGIGTDSTGCAPADADRDGDIDLFDFAIFITCNTSNYPNYGCPGFDLIPYGTTVAQFAAAFRTMTGPLQ